MKKLILAFFCVAAVCCGCVKFEYTGRSFEPVDETTEIAWYTPANPVPPGAFRVMGRAELIYAAGSFDSYDVEERLISEARKHGADAVYFAGIRKERTGVLAVDGSIDRSKRRDFESSTGETLSKERLQINDFDLPVTLTGSSKRRAATVVEAIFYKKSEYIRKWYNSIPLQFYKKAGETK